MSEKIGVVNQKPWLQMNAAKLWLLGGPALTNLLLNLGRLVLSIFLLNLI